MSKKNINNLLIKGAEKANKEKWEEAEDFFKQVLKISPKNPVALAGLGGILYQCKKYDASKEVLDNALRQNEIMPQSYYYWAKLCLLEEDWDNAIDSILCSINSAPNILEQYVILGDAYFKKGKFASAALAYSCLLKRKSGHIEGWKKLALCWEKQGNFKAAIEIYRYLLTLDPSLVEAFQRIKELAVLLANELSYGKIKEIKEKYNTESTNGLKKDKWWQQAICLLNEGRVGEGFVCLAQRAKQHRNGMKFEASWWNGEYFSGKRLLIYDEENYEDAVAFFKYLPKVKQRGGIVILAVRGEWVAQAKFLEGVDYVIEIEELSKLQNVHLECSLVALPYIFGTTQKSIHGELLSKNRGHSDECSCKIGLVCSEELIFLMEKLQSDITPCQCMKFSSRKNMSLVQFIEIVKSVDFIISDEQEVCHWAGLLDVPFLYLASWADGTLWWNEISWYSRASIVQQKVPGDWIGIEREVYSCLQRQGIGK